MRCEGEVGKLVGNGKFNIRSKRMNGEKIILGTEAEGPDDVRVAIAGRVDILMVDGGVKRRCKVVGTKHARSSPERHVAQILLATRA
jgi:hypothetical protein